MTFNDDEGNEIPENSTDDSEFQQNPSSNNSPSKPRGDGLVISSLGIDALVELNSGLVDRIAQKRGQEYAVVGDHVIVEEGDPPRIAEILPRINSLSRPHKRDWQTIAANIDRVVITVAVLPELHPRLIDRYLVTAEWEGIDSVIVLNKIDLENKQEALDKLKIYKDIGYKVLAISAIDGDNIEQLQNMLGKGTSVLSGHSGVGKSSILNAILPENNDREEIETGEISEASGRGRHTTTTAVAYRFKNGLVIDTPGIREFGLPNLEPTSLHTTFKEFRPYALQCKFDNCIHIAEPNCSVKAALKQGSIAQKRYDSYRYLYDELDNDTNRKRRILRCER